MSSQEEGGGRRLPDVLSCTAARAMAMRNGDLLLSEDECTVNALARTPLREVMSPWSGAHALTLRIDEILSEFVTISRGIDI